MEIIFLNLISQNNSATDPLYTIKKQNRQIFKFETDFTYLIPFKKIKN